MHSSVSVFHFTSSSQMSKVNASSTTTASNLVAIQCFVECFFPKQPWSLCCLIHQPESAQMLHKAESWSCKPQLPFKCVAMRVPDCVARATSSYLSVLVPSEDDCNGDENKFRASAGRQEESGAGSLVVTRCRVGVAARWKMSVIPSDKCAEDDEMWEITSVFSPAWQSGLLPGTSSGCLTLTTGEWTTQMMLGKYDDKRVGGRDDWMKEERG